MRQKLKFLLSLMKGFRGLYTLSMLILALATMVSLARPLVIRTTIDSIIGDKPIIDLPKWAIGIIGMIGGRSILMKNLWIMCLILAGLALINGIFSFFKGKWTAITSESIARKLREKLYDHIQHLSYDYHVKADTGDLIQRCSSDVDTVHRFLGFQFIELGNSIFMILAVVPIMISMDSRMTIMSMLMVPFLITFSLIFFKKIKNSFQEADEAEARLSTVLQENLTGVRVVRAFARQNFEIEKFDNANKGFRTSNYQLIRLYGYFWSVSDAISLFQISLVMIPGTYWAATGQLSLGTLVAFITYVEMFIWPVRQMGRILSDLGKTMVSITRIKEILDTPLEDFKTEGLKPEIHGVIEFNNVSFGYEKERLVLKNISFKIKKGQTIAILGATGTGKSSLVHLLPALYDYSEGSIKIDGHELKEIDRKWLRKNIGIVLQEPFLFSKSVRENIRLAHKDASEDEVHSAASIAAIHDVILEFENGYDTAVGEKGITLSGGQKQRVAISRTLIQKPPILILDDSLSAVDTETDALIRRALSENGYKATKFIISHRITTISEADLILVLENGEIVQSGTHEELTHQPGLYKRVWQIQNKLENEILLENGQT